MRCPCSFLSRGTPHPPQCAHWSTFPSRGRHTGDRKGVGRPYAAGFASWLSLRESCHGASPASAVTERASCKSPSPPSVRTGHLPQRGRQEKGGPCRTPPQKSFKNLRKPLAICAEVLYNIKAFRTGADLPHVAFPDRRAWKKGGCVPEE